MSYRQKTCSYCGGNHAILDCETLTKNGTRAVEVLSDWDNSEEKRNNKRSLLYYGSYDSERQDDGTWLYKKKSVAQSLDCYSVSKFVVGDDRYNRRTPDLCYWTKDEFAKAHAHLPSEITQERYSEAAGETHHTKERFECIAKQYYKNEEAKKKRANKSCSYCKGQGHTVRTCGQRNKDKDTYRDAYTISAYFTSRAASRFGTWTGSMFKNVQTAEGRLLHWTASNTFSGHRFMISGATTDQESHDKALATYNSPQGNYSYRHREGAPTVADDYIDWSYLRDFVSNMAYTVASKAYTREYVNYNERTTLHIGWNDLDFENDRIVYGDSEKEVHYPTRCADLHERIFSNIMLAFEPIAVPQRKGQVDDPRFCVSMADIKNSWQPSDMEFEPSHYGSNRISLFADKKERCKNAWEALEKFVENNQDILNKAENLIVK